MFNDNEIKMLMEGLDALQGKAISDGLMMGMLTMGLTKKEDCDLDEFENSMKDATKESDAINESVILLKAKLIKLKEKR